MKLDQFWLIINMFKGRNFSNCHFFKCVFNNDLLLISILTSDQESGKCRDPNNRILDYDNTQLMW